MSSITQLVDADLDMVSGGHGHHTTIIQNANGGNGGNGGIAIATGGGTANANGGNGGNGGTNNVVF